MPPSVSTPNRVLVVAPNRGFAEYIQTLLSKENIASTWVQDSSSVLQYVRSIEPPLVVCMQGLEDRTGLDVVSTLQSEVPSPPASILLSAEHSTQLKQHAQEAGVTSLFGIPFRAQRVLRTVNDIVRDTEAGRKDHLNDGESPPASRN